MSHQHNHNDPEALADVMEDLEEHRIAFRRDIPVGMMVEVPAAVMMIAPILALFLGLQRRFIEGLTQGGLK